MQGFVTLADSDLSSTMARHAALVACSATLASCGGWGGGSSCDLSIEPGVIVEIRDAITGVPLAANARGVVREGAYTDSLRAYETKGSAPNALVSRAAAYERPGTYSIEVDAPGHQSWRVDDVRVSKGECHVRTRRLTATLFVGT